MPKKYIFFDFDGTLTVGTSGEIPQENIECIKKLEENGHFVSLATGRLLWDAIEVSSSFKFKHIIADGGNSYYTNGKVIFNYPLNKESALNLLNDMEKRKIPWAVNASEDMKIIANKKYTDMLDFPFQFDVHYLENLKVSDLGNIYKIHLKIDDEQIKNTDFMGLMFLNYYKNGVLIEPMEKEKGIKKLLEKLDAKNEDVIVFGDGYNDLGMFDDNWYCVAMGNAVDSLKEKADFITKDSSESGIVFACKELGLI